MQQAALTLKFGGYADLHTVAGLTELDRRFIQVVADTDSGLHAFLQAYRQGESLPRDSISYGLIACAELLDQFIIDLFQIESDAQRLREQIAADNPIYWFKKQIVLKDAKRKLKNGVERSFTELSQLLAETLQTDDPELALAKLAWHASQQQTDTDQIYDTIVDWVVAAQLCDEGYQAVIDWVSFQLPHKLDFEHLIDVERVSHNGYGSWQADPKHFRQRRGFDLTDERMSRRQVMDQVHYCVYCHKNDGDFCSTGFPVKRKQPELGFKINPLDEVLAGCPLDEKISEMQALKRDGYSIGSLAMIMVDNPMCPATGHRICNDCMKSCIYQRQSPVDIPQIETRVLTDALHLPWGVEIYDLLTRWNPLRQQHYLPSEYNGKNVLVMGMGPAGFTLAHYLTVAGYAVVGMDGLKIEPVDEAWLKQPIRDFDAIYEPLSGRVVHGFGGVAEYGITVRWDKNFLKLIYISLMRRKLFQVQGGVRFGGTVTVEQAWQMGFHHLAVAVGAGLPKELHIENSLAPGMRQANDFLMALQLTGAAKQDSLANLQVRLPAVVIGGGLTGVDTATEVQAYYLTQITKVAKRYRILSEKLSEAVVRSYFNEHDLSVLDEFLQHAEVYAKAEQAAEEIGTTLDTVALIRQFGGVTIAYRRAMNQSPAYRSNHEELAKAMEEGLFYADHLSPKQVMLDAYGDCKALLCGSDGDDVVLPARSIFVATGAKPNVAYAFEHKHAFERHVYQYQPYRAIDDQLHAVEHSEHCKDESIGLFTSYKHDDKRVTFLGDTHPSFHGNVVKAIASGKRCFDAIDAYMKPSESCSLTQAVEFLESVQQRFVSKVVANNRLNEHAIELIVDAPQVAAMFEPGQFVRIQNFETGVKHTHDTTYEMEGLACLAAPVKGQPTQLSLTVFERGSSSRLAAMLQPDEAVCVMGPTGVRTVFSEDARHILLVGGSMAVAYLRSIRQIIESDGKRVVFVADFESDDDIIYRDDIEALCDEVIWNVRNSDSQMKTLSDAFAQWHKHSAIALAEFDAIITIGSSQLLCTMKSLRGTILAGKTRNNANWIASVYGPMQCMLKGVCAQCLQWQIDKNGQRTKAVYACSWQHQPFEKIEIDNIDQRLAQNAMQETLSQLWLDYCEED